MGSALLVTVLLLGPGQHPSISRPDARADEAVAAYGAARKRYYALMGDPKAKRFRDRWARVISAFQGVARDYPDSEEAAKATFTEGMLWSQMYDVSFLASDLEQGAAAYARVPERSPKSRLADDALVREAEIRLRLGDRLAAARALTKVEKLYARGDQLGEAALLREQVGGEAFAALSADPKAVARRVAGSRSAKGGRLQALRIFEGDANTRLVLDLKGDTQANSAVLPATGDSPPRVYVDLEPARLSDVVVPEISKGKMVTRLRVAQHSDDTVRIVAELDHVAEHRLYNLENPSRVVLDLYEGDQPTEYVEEPGDTGFHVVLDPGHGGKDPGAQGVAGIQEKGVVLDIAKRIKSKLEGQGIQVTLTRTDDTFVPLEERGAMANRLGADLFVSVHANANRNRSARGIETYYLNVAHDRYSRRLAAVENKVSADRLTELELILADMMTKGHADASKKLATRLQEAMVSKARQFDGSVRDLGIKPALFYVLLGARMPAVLLETSFVTNPAEGKLLGTPRYRAALADGIASEIRSFLLRDEATGVAKATPL